MVGDADECGGDDGVEEVQVYFGVGEMSEKNK